MSARFMLCRRPLPPDVVSEHLESLLRSISGGLAVNGDARAGLPGRGGTLLIYGNAAFFPNVFGQLRRMPPAERPTVAIWHTEPLPAPAAAGLPRPKLHLREVAKIVLRDPRATDVYTNWLTIRSLHRQGLFQLLVVSAPGRRDFLLERGIASHFIPVGYTPATGRDLAMERDIEVLFLGSLDVPRRNRILGAIRARGVPLTALGDWGNPAYFGEARTVLINRTKILLNLARTPGEYSGMRILMGLANRALVVSEPIYNADPYVAGKHFVMSGIEELPATLCAYLTDQKARAAIVEAGYHAALEEFTMERSLVRVLDAIEEQKANRGKHVETAFDSRRPPLRA